MVRWWRRLDAGGFTLRLRARIALLAAIVLVSISAFVLLGDQPTTPSASRAPDGSATRTPAGPDLADATTYLGDTFDPKEVPSPTASKAQSKLWFANGTWWGLLHEPASDELRIYRLTADGSAWVDTGTLVDERPLARGDALAVDDQVYVVTAGTRARPADGIRLIRFTFRDGTYRLDADFPVPLSDTGVETVVLTRDTKGRLWITYTFENRVWVRASDTDDHHWGAAFTPAVDGTAVSPDDIAAIVPFGESVGLMWSNQILDAVYFSVHRDTDPVEAWSPSEAVSRGVKQADDHINLKADEDGRVYAALKTSLDTLPNRNQLAAQITLVVRDRAGDWREHVVSRLKDRHTRAIVLIDQDRDEVYVVATSPSTGGSIYYKRAPLEHVSFRTGVGTLLIGDPGNPRISNVTSTKQVLTAGTGLVVLASDNTTARYLHGVLEIGARVPGPPPPVPPEGEPQVVVNDSFDSWRDQEPLPPGFVGRNLASGAATVRIRPDRGGVVRVVAIGDGPPPRVCRQFVPIAAGHALITFDIRALGSGRTEPVLALVRGDGGDAAQIRFGARGTFGYFDGGRRVDSTARWTPQAWYRVTLDLDVRAREMTMAIANGAGDRILRQTGIAWPGAASTVEQICFGAAAGVARPSIEIDKLRVARSLPED